MMMLKSGDEVAGPGKGFSSMQVCANRVANSKAIWPWIKRSMRIYIDNAFNFNLLVLCLFLLHAISLRAPFNDTIDQQKGHRCNLNIPSFYYICLQLQTLKAFFSSFARSLSVLFVLPFAISSCMCSMYKFVIARVLK